MASAIAEMRELCDFMFDIEAKPQGMEKKNSSKDDLEKREELGECTDKYCIHGNKAFSVDF